MFGKSLFTEESHEDRRVNLKKEKKIKKLHCIIHNNLLEKELFFLNEEMSFMLTLDRTAGGRVDLASIILNALGELYEGRVASEAAFGPR